MTSEVTNGDEEGGRLFYRRSQLKKAEINIEGMLTGSFYGPNQLKKAC